MNQTACYTLHCSPFSTAHVLRRVVVAMSSTKMWFEDPEDSYDPMHHYGNGESSSSQTGSPSTNASNATQCETVLDLDDDPVSVLQDHDSTMPAFDEVSPAINHPFLDDYTSGIDGDDSDDDLANGGAPIDILSITNVLTHGVVNMDTSPDDETDAMTDLDPADPQPALASGGHPPPPSTVPLPHQAHHAYGTHQLAPPVQPPYVQNLPHLNGQMPTIPVTASAEGNQPNNSNGHHVQLLHHPQMIHLNVFNNPNATALGPENYNLSDFVRVWAWQAGAWQGLPRERGRYPWPARINRQLVHNVSHIDYMDLEGDRYDVQGLDWEDLGVTRSEARERRLNTYKNYVNIANSDRWQVRQSLQGRTFLAVR